MENNWTPAEALCQKAMRLIEVARPSDCLPLLREAMQLDATDPLPWCLTAQAHLMLEDSGQALAAAEGAIRCAPDQEWGHRLRSLSLRIRGNLRGALLSALEAARLAPDVPEALFVLGAVQNLNGLHREAHLTAAKLRKIAPQSTLTYQLCGCVALSEERWSEAETQFRKALAIKADDPEIMNLLGVALDRQHQHSLSLDQFREAVRLEPNRAPLRVNLVRALQARLEELYIPAGISLMTSLILLGVGDKKGLLKSNTGCWFFIASVLPYLLLSTGIILCWRARILKSFKPAERVLYQEDARSRVAIAFMCAIPYIVIVCAVPAVYRSHLAAHLEQSRMTRQRAILSMSVGVLAVLPQIIRRGRQKSVNS